MKLLVLCIFVATASATSIAGPKVFIENYKPASVGLKNELDSSETAEFWNEMIYALKEVIPDMAEVVEVTPETDDISNKAAVAATSMKPPTTSPKPSKTTSKPPTTTLDPSDKVTWGSIFLGSDCLKTLDFIARHCQMTCKRP